MKKANKDKVGKNFAFGISICFLAISIAAFALALYLDICRNLTCQYDVANLSEIMLPSFIAFVSIWFTGYFIHFQIYRDRYPAQMLKKYYQPTAIVVIVSIIIIAIFGSWSIAVNACCSQIAFVAIALLCVVYLLAQAYCTNQTFMVTSYIAKCGSSIVANTKKNSKSPENIQVSLEELSKVFYESLAKDEHYVCFVIHEQLANFFEAQLETCNKRLLALDSKEAVDAEFRTIIKTMLRHLSALEDDSPDYFIQRMMHFQRKNIRKCMITANYDLYKFYIDEMLSLICAMAARDKDRLRKSCFAVIRDVIQDCLVENRADYLKICIDQCEVVTKSTLIVDKNVGLDDYITILALVLTAEKPSSGNGAGFSRVFDSFVDCSMFLAQLRGNFQPVGMCHLAVLHALVDGGLNDQIDAYLEFLKKSYRYLSEDDSWANCIQVIIEYLNKSNCFEGCNQAVNELKLHIIEMTILSKRDPSYLPLPDYKDTLSEPATNEDAVLSIAENYYGLISRSIRKNKLSIAYFLYKELAASILSLKSHHKNAQDKLLDVFFWTLDDTIYLNDKASFKLCLNYLEDCLRDLDKEALISESLGCTIISKLFTSAEPTSCQGEDLRALLIDRLHDFMKEDKEFHFILNKIKVREMYYRKWLDIGIRCLEEGNETLLRRVSGSVGWSLIYALKRYNRNEIMQIIEVATQLHSYSLKFELSDNTRVFLLTLFTVVGSYCCKDPRHFLYRAAVIDHLVAHADYHMVKLATEIRFVTNNGWEDTFGDTAVSNSGVFLGELKRAFEHSN